jgi:peptidoglycan/xylan/chitin deacetylase (PgdA/CDA1 family)
MKKVVIVLLFALTGLYGHAQIIIKKIPDKLVVFTFDDATASQYSIVAPLLKQYGFGATFYICEFPPSSADSNLYMNWRQIKELDRMGFEIANHTKSHPQLSKLTPDEIDLQIAYIEHKCDSMHISKPVTFAYPGYDLNMDVIDILRKKGYEFARGGGRQAYDPLKDYPLLIPSWAMVADNKAEIMKAFDEARNGKIVVLTIHGVPDLEHPWVNTPPELFKEYLQYLSDKHFNVISLRELSNYVNAKEAFRTLVPDLSRRPKY